MENLNNQLLELIDTNNTLTKKLKSLSTAPTIDNGEKRMLKEQNNVLRQALCFYLNLETSKGNYNSVAKNALLQVKLVA